jgi:uncharacterized protein (DUF488 family)
MLRAYAIEVLADVRTVPKSRRNPQFVQERLRSSLAGAGIEYRHMKHLGGLQRAAADSVNTGWRNASFRGYADHMQTAGFARAVDEIIAVAQRANCDHVRRGRSLAVPSLTDRGCLAGAGYPRHRHPEREAE